MGYSTDFFGEFILNKGLDAETHSFLKKLNETRRMKRNIEGFGVEGEFFVDGTGFAGQDDDSTVIDHNRPPANQPGLWCQWRPTEDGLSIEWDGNEKFYKYVEWLQYIITNVLAPRGYSLTGTVAWQGEDSSDIGKIKVTDNKIKVLVGVVTYKESEG